MTTTVVTLNTIPGAEYRIGNANWQDSPTFGGLVPNTAYTFYARMKETDTHNASPASGKLSVTTHTDADAGLLSLAVNGNPLSVAGRELDWQAECGETSVRLDLEVSYAASATVRSGGAVYGGNATVPLSGDMTVIGIDIVSGNGENTGRYSLTVANPLDAGDVLFRRWEDVVAVNINPASNGNRNIGGVCWDGNAEVPDSSWFVRLAEGEHLYAKINIADRWHNVCGEPKKRSATVAAYPNPVSTGENLTLQLPGGFTGGYMNVVSLSGSTVKRKLPLPNSFNTVSVADWAPGVYLLDITAPNGDREAVKIIVSN
jgi:hypothetical protein